MDCTDCDAGICMLFLRSHPTSARTIVAASSPAGTLVLTATLIFAPCALLCTVHRQALSPCARLAYNYGPGFNTRNATFASALTTMRGRLYACALSLRVVNNSNVNRSNSIRGPSGMKPSSRSHAVAFAGFIVLLLLVTLRGEVNPADAAHPSAAAPPPGTQITYANWQQYKQFMPPEIGRASCRERV